MKENSAHGFTEGSEVPKEQDVAPCFDKIIELTEELNRTRLLLQNCNGDIIRADRELTRLRSELQQERELRKELVECIESYIDLELFANPKPIESLIAKSKAK